MLRFIIAHINRNPRCELQLGTDSQTMLIRTVPQLPTIGLHIHARPTGILEASPVLRSISVRHIFHACRTIKGTLTRHTAIPVHAKRTNPRHVLQPDTHATVIASEPMVIKQIATVIVFIVHCNSAITDAYIRRRSCIRCIRQPLLCKPHMTRCLIIMT